MKKIIIFVVIIIVIFLGYIVWKSNTVPNTPVEITSEPTNFAKTGVIIFNTPGLKPNVPYLIYEEPGSPALTKELVFDPLSVCAAENGSTECIAMSVTLDVPFGGKRATIEGIKQADDTILVRKLQKISEGEQTLLAQPGHIFIPWRQAVQLIEKCAVSMVLQTHNLDVHLTLTDDRQVIAVEPTIDAIFPVVQKSISACGTIPVATE